MQKTLWETRVPLRIITLKRLSMALPEMTKFKPYATAPIELHRLCTDIRTFPPAVQTAEDVNACKFPADVAVTQRDGKLFAIKHGLPAAHFDCNKGLKKAGGVSLLGMYASENTLKAAHDLVRRGKQLTCLVYKADVAAPDQTAFVHDKVWGPRFRARHCLCVPMEELEVQSLQESVANPQHPDETVWQPCPFGGGENPVSYKQPPYPSDTRLREVSVALEAFALDEEQEAMLRMAARLYRYEICEEDAENDKDWGDILADANLEVLHLLKLALQLTQEPSDINRLLAFRMVKVEVDDQIQSIKVSMHGLESGATKLLDTTI